MNMSKYSCVYLKDDELDYMEEIFYAAERRQNYADAKYVAASNKRQKLDERVWSILPHDKAKAFLLNYVEPMYREINKLLNTVNDRTVLQNVFIDIIRRAERQQ